MPSGVYKRTAKTRKALSEAQTGLKRSKESVEKRASQLRGKKRPKEVIEKIRIANTGQKRTEETKQKIRDARANQVITEETKEKLRQKMMGNQYRTGKPDSDEVRKQKRLTAIERTEKMGIEGYWPNYNQKGCKIIDEYGVENGYNFQHAENGGEYHIKELGYWVDGYDKENNVVIEYYEEAHKYTKEKDDRRKKEIEDYLGCKFIVINERR
jgi:hypothetical protein